MTLPKIKGRPALTLHQLRIIWAVAHAGTVGRAAKQIGLSQPSLSQQIANVETNIGRKVFERRANGMIPTEIGAFLVDRAELLMREMQHVEDGLGSYLGGTRVISIAGISSPIRVLLPHVLSRFRQAWPAVEIDVHEDSPADVLAMLYARRANVGIVAATSIAQVSVGFIQIPLFDDPYVLVVPEELDLGRAASEDKLGAAPRQVLNRVIQFVYGTQHQKRIEQWYETTLPNHRVVARCRSFESAVGLVRAGLGVCLAPALSCFSGDSVLDGLKLYDVNLPIPRPLVALMPSQYRNLEPYPDLTAALKYAAQQLPRPRLARAPSFLRRADGAASDKIRL
jgi:DNA-binding transcriptional LysR family regulator